MASRKRVMVESPFSAPDLPTKNEYVRYAREAVLNSLGRGEAAFASHLFYTEWLDDDKSLERLQGIESNHAWTKVADLVAVYADYGISLGMKAAIDLAYSLDIPVEYRTTRNNNNNNL